jgi:hypothetical protein
MAELRGCYGLRETDPEAWKTTLMVYFKKLGGNNPEAIEKGFDMAWKQHGSFFPSAFELLESISAAGKTGTVQKAYTPPEHQLEDGEGDYVEDGAERARAVLDDIGTRMDMNNGDG